MFRVSDNGDGFEPRLDMMDALRLEGKRGLNGMRQRAELLGGKFEFISAPGKWTVITITIFAE